MNKHLEKALVAVQKASQVCVWVQEHYIKSVSKEDSSPVTIADFAVQAIVSHLLGEDFPDLPMVGEESASILRENAELCTQVVSCVQRVLADVSQEQILDAIDRGSYAGGKEGVFWVLDPIDGTKGFLRKEQYALALALIKNGEVQLGVLGCPNLPFDLDQPEKGRGMVFYAQKGEGAFSQPLEAIGVENPVRITTSRDPYRFCESVEKGHSAHAWSEQIAQAIGIHADPIRLDSQCKYAVVAQGQAAVYLRLPTRKGYQEKIWDHAAGVIVITEGGGAVTDIHGKPLDFSRGRTLADNTGVVASSDVELQATIIKAIKELSYQR